LISKALIIIIGNNQKNNQFDKYLSGTFITCRPKIFIAQK